MPTIDTDTRPAEIAAAVGRFYAAMVAARRPKDICATCEGHGEIYRADRRSPIGYDGPFGNCRDCGGTGEVDAKCDCGAPAVTIEDGEFCCMEHGGNRDTATGAMAALAIETIREMETN